MASSYKWGRVIAMYNNIHQNVYLRPKSWCGLCDYIGLPIWVEEYSKFWREGEERGRWVTQRTPPILATSVSCVQWNGETALKEKWGLDCYFLLEVFYKCKMSQGRLFLYFPFCLILFAKILSAKGTGSKRQWLNLSPRESLSVICLLVEFMDIRGFEWLVFLNTQCAHKIERTNCAVCSFLFCSAGTNREPCRDTVGRKPLPHLPSKFPVGAGIQPSGCWESLISGQQLFNQEISWGNSI